MNNLIRSLACFLLLSLFLTLAIGCESDEIFEDGITSTTTKATTTSTSAADVNAPETPTPINLGYESTVSYANWSDDERIEGLALNSELTENKKNRIPIYRFDTLDDLEGFKSDFGDVLSMDADYNEIPSFEDATAAYDDAFFAENSILLVYVTASSGSYRYQIVDIELSESSVCVLAKRTTSPLEGTCDMAGWFLTLAIPDEELADLTVFDAQLDDTAS